MKKPRNSKLAVLWYSHPRWAIALMLIVINVGVILCFTTALSIITQNNFFKELAYVFTFTMSADGVYDFVNSSDDVVCFILKIILALIQMLIFSGALIGFTTDLLQTTIDKRLNNVGKLNLNGHYVFLNWSLIGPRAIYELSFLEGEKNIVILSEKDREEVLSSIQNVFIENKRKMRGMRVFVKNGSPMSSKHLSEVSLDKAKHVAVLLAGLENDGNYEMSANDLNALKTLLSMMNVGVNANIVVEAEQNETLEKIEKLLDTINPELNDRIVVFSHNSVVGHIMGRSLVNPLFNDVYHELLSYDGVEFYGIPTMDMDEALSLYNDCIPIINYDDDCAVDENGEKQPDQLYVLSDNAQTLGERVERKTFIKPLAYIENDFKEEFTVFIISKERDATFVIDELDKYSKINGIAVKYQNYTYSDDIGVIKEQISKTKGQKKVLLLSAVNDNGMASDADVFLGALNLKLNGDISDDTTIYAEIYNPINMQALRNLGVLSVILSNRIVSRFMIQILTHPNSKRFYRDLISVNDNDGDDAIDIDIVKAKEVLAFDSGELHFSCQSEFVQSFYYSSNKRKMCIGIKNATSIDGKVRFLCDGMDKEEDLIVRPDDDLVLILY